jgi:RHS repeat-associated protein
VLVSRREDIRAGSANPPLRQTGCYAQRTLRLISGSITSYLLDIQPGLHVVLSETQGANVTRHIHSLRGIHAHKDAANNWEWPLQDGLGSVREVVDNSVAVLESRNYDPFGNGFGNTGTSQTNYGFTGELVDGGGLLDLRARRYAPGLGVFASLDPLETPNRYGYVSGNPVNLVDPSGLQPETGAACAAFVFADGPFPFGDAVCLGLLAVTGIASLINLARASQAVGQNKGFQPSQTAGQSPKPPSQEELIALADTLK